MKLLVFLTVTVLTVANASLHAWPDPTRGGSGVNLNGRMFTLSSYNGGVVFYSPYQPPPWATPTPYQTSGYTSRYSTTGSNTQTNTALTDTSTESYSSTYPTTPRTTHSTTHPTTHSTTHSTTRRTTPRTTHSTTPRTTHSTTHSTTRRTTHLVPTTRRTTHLVPTTRRTTHLTTPYTTTAPPTRGVSVCLRYITGTQSNKIFTLSPSSSRLSLNFNGPLIYELSLNYQSMYLLPNIRLWPDMKSNIWTNICITLDTVKGVAQMFRDSEMSSRKLINNQFVWSGEAVIDFTGFEGQVTDVQVWDYPLRYKEVLYYMSSGFYGLYQGSVLNWSHISYSVSGKTLLEDSYEQQIRAPNRRVGRRHQLRGERKPRKLFHMERKGGRRDHF